MKLPERVRRLKCASCVFRDPQQGGIDLTPARREEIKLMLIQGGNQLCHHDYNLTVCRGSRDFQLQCWAEMGIIPEPTDEALRQAMLAAGVPPGPHI